MEPDYALFSLQTYEKVATAFKLEEDVVIANLDADKYKDLAEKWVLFTWYEVVVFVLSESNFTGEGQ